MRNALDVLAEVVEAGPGVTAKEISAALRLPRATTYRLLNLLVAEEYLVRLPDLRGFALGARAGRLSVPEVPRPSTAAKAIVAHLRTRVRWGVHLASYAAGHVTMVDPDPDHPPSPAHVLAMHPELSALGKLLLAEERGSELSLARQCGELHPALGCLAVPIRAPGDSSLVAGLALSGPANRVAEPNTELVSLLEEHAARLAPLLA